MTTTTAPTRPVRPAQPDDLRYLIEDNNRLVRELNKYQRVGRRFDTDGRVGQMIWDDLMTARQMIRDWYATAEGIGWRVTVNAYNAAVEAWNAHVKAEKQARVNAREVKKVRSQSCPRCFASHVGEC